MRSHNRLQSLSSTSHRSKCLRQLRTFDEIQAGMIVFARTHFSVELVQALGLGSNSTGRQIRRATHPILIVVKNLDDRVLTGVQITSTPMAEVEESKRRYLLPAQNFVRSQHGIMVAVKFARISDEGHVVRYSFQLRGNEYLAHTSGIVSLMHS